MNTGRPESIYRKIVSDLCTRFKETPTLTLAKKAVKDNPKVFMSIEHARSCIRVERGKYGAKMRKDTLDKSNFDKTERTKNPFNLPESHSENFEPYKISQSRTLIISDLHVPYHNNKAIELALSYGLQKGVNCILINGDLFDFATISRHEKDWRHRTIEKEFEAVKSLLNTIRACFPKAKIVYKLGNHDERWEKYLYVKAPEIFDCKDFQLEVLLKLGELKIDIVKDKRPVQIGKLTVLHGHELIGSGGVNPARATFTKTLESVLVGHYHRTSEHTEPTMGGDVINVNSTGCLCGMNPLWMPINKWNHGFAYVELDIKSGEYTLSNLKIVKGKIF